MPVQTKAPQKNLRPRNKSIRQGKSDSAWHIFVWAIFGKLFWKKRSNIDSTKMYQVDLDSPCRELSNGGFWIVAALPVRSGIYFLCACTGGLIQLYGNPGSIWIIFIRSYITHHRNVANFPPSVLRNIIILYYTKGLYTKATRQASA